MIYNDDYWSIVQTLNKGGVILYPTDTIWGLGCDATNEQAVNRIFAIKDRPLHKTFILLVDSIPMLKKYVSRVHPRIETLLDYHTRPLTVIYKYRRGLAPNCIAEDNTVAIRKTLDPFCKGLIGELGKPIVATSANFSDEPFPKNFIEISKELKEKVDLIVDYKQEIQEMFDPSPIVKLSEKADLIFLRD